MFDVRLISVNLTFKAKSIAKKWKKALQDLKVTKLAFEEMNDRIDDGWLSEWKQLEKDAMEKRGELLRIYDVADNNGMRFTIPFAMQQIYV
jgi:hypothetical protein